MRQRLCILLSACAFDCLWKDVILIQQKYKIPGKNYLALKTPSLHGKIVNMAPKSGNINLPMIFILEFIALGSNIISLQVFDLLDCPKRLCLKSTEILNFRMLI